MRAELIIWLQNPFVDVEAHVDQDEEEEEEAEIDAEAGFVRSNVDQGKA